MRANAVLRVATATGMAAVVGASAWGVGAPSAGAWRYRPDERPDRPRTLLFCPMQPDYLKDSASHGGEVGFNGFIISVGGWQTDIWSRDGDATTRGTDDGYLKQFRAANIATRAHGGGWNFPKASVGSRLPDWFDDAAWNGIVETFRQ